ncbi:hypothetical protein BV898_18985 [Hypsibius exemplaris]|uniref:Uncharacterized protein n=1 Tax=Hypsibius exemplaris TaxID=2072580 RepID=A0A9X6NHW5_HYPEX|nr:hypothetical protein BV898_18985 [Hypsibius exemplaris]
MSKWETTGTELGLSEEAMELLPEDYGFTPRYGQLRCGMPLSSVSPKLAQFELLDVRTGLAIPGPKLENQGADGRPKIVAENVLLIQSTPERLIIWKRCAVESFNPYLDYDYEFDIVFVVLTDEERGGVWC